MRRWWTSRGDGRFGPSVSGRLVDRTGRAVKDRYLEKANTLVD